MVYLLCVLLKIFGAWFLVTGIIGLLRRPARFRRTEPRTRFACLIPARNEETVIARSVESLLAQDYPRDMFEVFALPNNCTDRTGDAAASAGARIIDIAGSVRCKGEVLRQAITDRRVRAFDAVCVFDADNLVAPDYLARMNDAFCAGARVAKGGLRSLNAYDSGVSGCYALYFGIFDWFFNRSRAALSMSAKLVGTGFAVSLDFLNKAGGWNTDTFAEDAEFSSVCAELGERVWWVPEAVSYDEAPISFRESLRQRKRWCSGIMDVARLRTASLFSAAFGLARRRSQAVHAPDKRENPVFAEARRSPAVPETRRIAALKKLRAFDGAMFLCSPYAQAASPLSFVLATVCAKTIAMPLIYLAVSWIGMTGFGALLAVLSGYRDIRVIKSVLIFPLFMASWVPLQLISLFRRTEKWEEIRHGVSHSSTAGHSASDARTGPLEINVNIAK